MSATCQDREVGTRQRRSDRGIEQAAWIMISTGSEIRLTRRRGGTSIRTAARSVALSESTYGRIERAKVPNVTVAQLALACSAVGLKLVARAYPDGSPVRDAAHLRLLARLRAKLPEGTRARTEVPIPIAGDRRAWDLVVQLGSQMVGVEAETRLTDIQELERRIALKVRDSPVTVAVLLIADTAAHRRALRLHREALRASFPLDTRALMAALRAGVAPAHGGVAIL